MSMRLPNLLSQLSPQTHAEIRNITPANVQTLQTRVDILQSEIFQEMQTLQLRLDNKKLIIHELKKEKEEIQVIYKESLQEVKTLHNQIKEQIEIVEEDLQILKLHIKGHAPKPEETKVVKEHLKELRALRTQKKEALELKKEIKDLSIQKVELVDTSLTVQIQIMQTDVQELQTSIEGFQMQIQDLQTKAEKIQANVFPYGQPFFQMNQTNQIEMHMRLNTNFQEIQPLEHPQEDRFPQYSIFDNPKIPNTIPATVNSNLNINLGFNNEPNLNSDCESLTTKEVQTNEQLILDVKNTIDYFNFLGQNFLKNDNYSHARNAFEHVLTLEPNNSIALDGISETFLSH